MSTWVGREHSLTLVLSCTCPEAGPEVCHVLTVGAFFTCQVWQENASAFFCLMCSLLGIYVAPSHHQCRNFCGIVLLPVFGTWVCPQERVDCVHSPLDGSSCEQALFMIMVSMMNPCWGNIAFVHARGCLIFLSALSPFLPDLLAGGTCWL